MTSYNKTIADTQQMLNNLGFNAGKVDGIWGNNSQKALDALKQSCVDPTKPFGLKKVCWGAKLKADELQRVGQIVTNLNLPKLLMNDLMACMAFETGETFSPSIKNGAGAPYYGLIQFGAAAAKDVGTTLDALVKMSVIEQLAYVEKFFKPYASKIGTLGDVYMRILYPAAVGKPDDHVLFTEGTIAYEQNKGLDLNKDGKITKLECTHKVINKYVRGLLPQFAVYV